MIVRSKKSQISDNQEKVKERKNEKKEKKKKRRKKAMKKKRKKGKVKKIPPLFAPSRTIPEGDYANDVLSSA